MSDRWHCTISPDITRYAGVSRTIYDLDGNQPARHRRGCVFTIDPSLRRTENALSQISVPHERLRDGITGAFFAVDATDCATGIVRCRPSLAENANEDSLDQGRPVSHCRNAYLVAMHVYESFRRALGRPVAWSFWTEQETPPLTLVPFGAEEVNAWYDPARQEIRFGYGTAPEGPDARADAGIYRFTALSSDVVAHEVTHALLDGLRPGYDLPVNPDVAAFHEAFADIVALLSRFERSGYIQSLLRLKGEQLLNAETLTNLAPDLGQMIRKSGLRTLDVDWTSVAIASPAAKLPRYGPEPTEPHERGGLLASAVFEAFMRSVARRVDPLLTMTGQANGATYAYLLAQIGETAAKTASHFLTICIRAIDYCPPAAIIFPDYLRALVTSDRILSSEDRHGYREDLIEAFRRRGIFPEGIDVSSEHALSWHPPSSVRPYPIPGLALGEMRFDRLPSLPKSPAELRRQALALAQAINADPHLYRELGLRDVDASGPDAELSAPMVTSVRPVLRTGPDGFVDFSTIAEITQTCSISLPGTSAKLPLRGGATLICDVTGTPRCIIRQRVDNRDRLDREIDFARDAISKNWLEQKDGLFVPSRQYRIRLCASPSARLGHLSFESGRAFPAQC